MSQLKRLIREETQSMRGPSRFEKLRESRSTIFFSRDQRIVNTIVEEIKEYLQMNTWEVDHPDRDEMAAEAEIEKEVRKLLRSFDHMRT